MENSVANRASIQSKKIYILGGGASCKLTHRTGSIPRYSKDSFGVLSLALSYSLLLIPAAAGLIGTLIVLALILVFAFIAGQRASQRTGRTATGVWAGLLTGAISALLTVMVNGVFAFANLDATVQSLKNAAQSQGANPNLVTPQAVMTTLISDILIIWCWQSCSHWLEDWLEERLVEAGAAGLPPHRLIRTRNLCLSHPRAPHPLSHLGTSMGLVIRAHHLRTHNVTKITTADISLPFGLCSIL